MPTYTARGTSAAAVSGSVTWSTLTNAYDASSATFATSTSAAAGALHALEVSGYGFNSSIPANETVTGISVAAKQYVSTTARFDAATALIQLYDGSTLVESIAFTLSGTSTNSQTITFTASSAAKSANFKVRATATRTNNNSTSQTFYVDYLDVTVTTALPSTEAWGVLYL